jgi:diguanylate cyclase (GGDEF)-like protein/PAS domain S-box-containing protein
MERFLSALTILDDLYDGLYLVDGERRIKFWNKAAETITGFDRTEIVGQLCHDNRLMHVDAAGRHLCQNDCPLAATLIDGQRREAEVFLRHKAGHRLPVLIRVAPVMDKDGRVVAAVEIFSDNSSLIEARQRLEELQRLALLDELTELPNRRHIENQINIRLAEFQRIGWNFGVLFIDIDHFKAVNDTHGHDVGDQVLRMVGQTLAHNSRPYDLAGRWGGEEFLAVIHNVDRDLLGTIADRYRVLVKESSLLGPGGLLSVTVSVGGTLARTRDDLEQLVKRADEQLYLCKHTGRDRISID